MDMKDEPFETSTMEQRLRELDQERSGLLESLKEAKRAERYAGKRLELGQREYPETAEERIALFERLFVARKDVYPRFWQNERTGKKGYAPACEAVWEQGHRLKATELFARYGSSKFYPLDKRVLEAHLRGRETVGTYAIRTDDTCIFLAADFDGDGWKSEVTAYRESAAQLGVSVLVEVSRSGNGAHAWIFFSEPVPAFRARLLGSYLVAQVESKLPSAARQAFDRLFPNQDSMPQGGFGNLIALPLQKERRSHGCTVFVDEAFEVYSGQWQVLSDVTCLSHDELDEILGEIVGSVPEPDADCLDLESLILESSEAQVVDYPPVEDWQVHLDESVTIQTSGLPGRFVAKLLNLARFPNPVFFQKQRQRFPTYDTPRRIFAGELHQDRIVLPRGCLEDVIELFAQSGSRVEVLDRRLKPKRIKSSFVGELTSVQNRALEEMKAFEYGVLVAPPGSGKTVMACAMIAARKVPTLILVHRRNLADQWEARLTQFLDVERKQIGFVQTGRKKPKGLIDIASVQTLSRRENLKQLFREYGMVIIDECHHVPSVSLESVMKECGSRYILGLTATPKRKDGLEQLLFMQCGSIRHVLSDPASACLDEEACPGSSDSL